MLEYNKVFRDYAYNKIRPLYLKEPTGHNWNHILEVQADASYIISKIKSNYTELHDKRTILLIDIAILFHDIALSKVDFNNKEEHKRIRKIHEVESAKIFKNDKFIKDNLSPNEIKLIAEAIEDHRASGTISARSIIGKILFQADRCFHSGSAKGYFNRSIKYNTYYAEPGTSRNEILKNVLKAMKDKYGKDGYGYRNQYFDCEKEDIERFKKDMDKLITETEASDMDKLITETEASIDLHESVSNNYLTHIYEAMNALIVANDMPGLKNNREESVYIVNYMQNNAFAQALTTDYKLRNAIIRDPEDKKLKFTSVDNQDQYGFDNTTDIKGMYHVMDKANLSEGLEKIKSNIGKEVPEGFIYECILGDKIYSFDQIDFTDKVEKVTPFNDALAAMNESIRNYCLYGREKADLIAEIKYGTNTMSELLQESFNEGQIESIYRQLEQYRHGQRKITSQEEIAKLHRLRLIILYNCIGDRKLSSRHRSMARSCINLIRNLEAQAKAQGLLESSVPSKIYFGLTEQEARKFNSQLNSDPDECKYFDEWYNYFKNLSKETIQESEDKSNLTKNYKKDPVPYKTIDIYNDECYKYFNKKEIDWYRKDKRQGEILVETDRHSAIGYIYVKDREKQGIVVGPFKVFDYYKGMGFGEILLKDAIKKYKANYLGVFVDNKVAIKLYEKVGFKIVETKVDKDGEKYYVMKL